MLNNNKYINKMREIIRLNKINDIYKNEDNDEEETIKTNYTNYSIDTIYNTHNVIIQNVNKYQFNGDIQKYIPNPLEFTNKENNYTNFQNINKKVSYDTFFNVNYDDSLKYNSISLIMYYINKDIIPFVMLFMIKDNTNKLYTFPQMNMNIDSKIKIKQLNKYINHDIETFVKDNYNYESNVKGVKNYNNTTYIFTEIKKIENSNSFNKGIWALPHELINDKKILNMNVSNIIIEFIINNLECITLNHKYEQPIVAYQLITNDSELNIFYTLDNFNKLILNRVNKIKQEQFHRVALFIGKLKLNINGDKNVFRDCDSIYKYDKYRQLSMLLIKSDKQLVYLSTHRLNDYN